MEKIKRLQEENTELSEVLQEKGNKIENLEAKLENLRRQLLRLGGGE